ncbi:MAG: CotH kinase family protein [Bacteroidaceae bacterium]|nr:CotH kinase family protein [Bacteroidaceae bacterium]
MQRILFLLLILMSLPIHAQEITYEEMKGKVNGGSLPLVNIIVDMASMNITEYVRGEIEITDYYCRTNPSSEVSRFHCLYRIRGASSTRYNKKSFAVKLIDENGEDLDANIFGIRNENSWILDAMAIDRTRMRNRLCFDIWNDISQLPYETNFGKRNGTKGEFVEVFVNGDYLGLFCMSDKIDRKLLGLKKVQTGDDGSADVRGILYKGINWKAGYNLMRYEEMDVDKVTWNAWELKYPDDYPSIDTWQPLMDLISFCSYSTSDETFKTNYNDYFYKENLTDYILFALALGIGDNLYKNTFLSVVNIAKAHRYVLTPWDMDMSLGGNYDGEYNDVVAPVRNYTNAGPYNRLIEHNIDGFNDSLNTMWREHSETLFSVEKICMRLDSCAEKLVESGAWKREWEKWNGNPVPLEENLFDELQYVKGWYEKNYNFLCRYFGMGTTGLTSNQVNKKQPDIYMLDGRKAANYTVRLRKGFYIEGSKKIVVR